MIEVEKYGNFKSLGKNKKKYQIILIHHIMFSNSYYIFQSIVYIIYIYSVYINKI